jgi:hypothetical protein
MPVIKEIVAVVGQYEKNGETKKQFRKVGSLHTKDDGGMFITMDKIFNPAALAEAGRDKIILSLYDPKPKEEVITGTTGMYVKAPEVAAIDDEIQF